MLNHSAGLWTPARKRRLRESRIGSTRVLAETLAHLARPPAVFLTASAVGWYGNRGDELLDETSTPGTGFLAELCADVQSFQRNVGENLRDWRQALDAYKGKRQRVALWGAGSKAAGFLTALNVTDEVGCVVDINPNKHGYYQAGTQQRIVAPRSLKEYEPDVVIIMNPIYRDEIRKDLDTMGLAPELLAL